MTSFPHHRLSGLTLALVLPLLAWLSSPAQEAAKPAGGSASPADAARISPLLAKSRIAFFRDLLEMSPAERKQALAAYSPAKRQGLEAKIKEYEALSPEQRELRLMVTELQDYLLPLMAFPATNQAAQIALLPTNIAPMVLVRLQKWDELPTEQQKEVLENKRLFEQLTKFASISPIQQNQVLTNMPPPQREALQQSLVKWQSLSRERRQEISQHVLEIFELTPAEKQKIFRTVSEAERIQIEKTVRLYYDLNPKSKVRVRAGLEKFCQLSPSEFQGFLRNAERWQALSPSERKAWRDLVASASNLAAYPAGTKPPQRMPPLPGDPGAIGRMPTNK